MDGVIKIQNSVWHGTVTRLRYIQTYKIKHCLQKLLNK